MAKRSKLFAKTIKLVSVIFLAVAVVVATLFSGSFYLKMMKQYESKGLAIATSISSATVDLLLNQDAASIQARVDEYKSIDDVAYLIIKDKNNVVIAHTFVPYVPDEIKALHDEFLGKAKEKIQVNDIRIKRTREHFIDISAPLLLGELGVAHIGMDVSTIQDAIINIVTKIVGLLSVLFIISILVIRAFVSKIASPLSQLSKYSDALANHNFETPLESKPEITSLIEKSDDEIGELAATFSHLEESLITHIQELKVTLSEKSKIENELNIAKSIQIDMLPNNSDLKSLSPNSSIGGYMRTMKEVGGDFYDAFTKDQDLFIVMGDVSGKGVSAALFMSTAMTFIRSLANQYHSPSDLLFHVNEALCKQNSNNLFVTLFIGVIDCNDGSMLYCNAGHPAPLLKSEDGKISELPYTGGMALAVDPSFYFEENEHDLIAGDQLCLFTDGITEAMNKDQELYGEERLFELVKTLNPQSSEDVCQRIVEDVDIFAADVDQADDISLLALQWKGKPKIDIGNELKVHFINEISEIEKLHYVVKKFAKANNLKEEWAMSINLALEELLSNTIFYGYQDHEAHYIEVYMAIKNKTFIATIEDDGIPFNPIDRPEVDIEKSLDDTQVGGLGIHFVKNLMDTLSYKRENNKNSLTLEKKLEEDKKES